LELVLPKELALEFKSKIHYLKETKKGDEKGELYYQYRTVRPRRRSKKGPYEEGRHEEAIAIAKNLLNNRMSPKSCSKAYRFT